MTKKKVVTEPADVSPWTQDVATDIEDAQVARLEGQNYPDESELETISDGLPTSESRDGKWQEIGTTYEGIFRGMRACQTRDGRVFAMASLAVNRGSTVTVEEIFLPVRAAAFFYTYEFPQGEFIRIEYIGDKPIPGRNPMKLFKFMYPKRLKLAPVESDLLTAREMKQLLAPMKKKQVVLPTKE